MTGAASHLADSQCSFVIAAYAIGIAGTLAMTGWSWLSMRRSEARREAARRR